jgi:hypothetical protein
VVGELVVRPFAPFPCAASTLSHRNLGPRSINDGWGNGTKLFNCSLPTSNFNSNPLLGASSNSWGVPDNPSPICRRDVDSGGCERWHFPRTCLAFCGCSGSHLYLIIAPRSADFQSAVSPNYIRQSVGLVPGVGPLRCDADYKITNLRYGAARRSRNQNGARLWSKTQPQRVAVGISSVLRLVLRTQPRSGKLARTATISGDTDRVQLCATLNTYLPANGWNYQRVPSRPDTEPGSIRTQAVPNQTRGLRTSGLPDAFQTALRPLETRDWHAR